MVKFVFFIFILNRPNIITYYDDENDIKLIKLFIKFIVRYFCTFPHPLREKVKALVFVYILYFSIRKITV